MKEITSETLKRKLTLLNPHWETGSIDPPTKAFKRRAYFDLLFPLVHESQVQRAVVVMGPRRVGKTVLLWQTIQGLLDRGVDARHIFYVSLDEPLFANLALEKLLELYREIVPGANLARCKIFFDEIQYLPQWERHLKVLVDRHPGTRFVASGSAAAALQRKSRESGAGRFTDFFLPPLTFYEYLELLGKTENLLKDPTGAVRPRQIQKLNEEFVNYLNYGGFPEAIFNPEIRRRPEQYIRNDIIDKVLLRDLPSLYGIPNTQELNRFFGALAYQTAQEVSLQGLSQQSGLAKNTISKYLEYLDAAFLIRLVQRVDLRGRTFKRANYFKVYLTNPSIYSALFGLVGPEESDALGALVETAIFCQWMHSPRFTDSIRYARWDGGKGEVDIIGLSQKQKVDWCVEVKWSDRAVGDPSSLRNLNRFCRENRLPEALVTTRSKRGACRVSPELEFRFTEAAVYCFVLGRDLIR